MRKGSRGSFTRVFDSKDKGGCESVAWEGLETMFAQGVIKTLVPERFEYSHAVMSGTGYVHRHVVCKLRNGDVVTLVLYLGEGDSPRYAQRWSVTAAVVQYADGRRVELTACGYSQDRAINVFWTHWNMGSPVLELWRLEGEE